ncbi:hypothetical protein EDC96DRAFT_550285 [Choanephora cucurbitarum]|nr:hypothetical protein EDC96DRAFT_550285 [Choanephora cucurbitarum]
MFTVYQCPNCVGFYANTQMELTAHIRSAQCTYNAAVTATEEIQAANTVATPSGNATNSVASDSDVASEDTNMSSNSDVNVGEVDISVEPMDVDVSLPATNEDANSTDHVTYNWTPSEPLSEAKAAWITVMQVLDEAKTPREYQLAFFLALNKVQILSLH